VYEDRESPSSKSGDGREEREIAWTARREKEGEERKEMRF